MNADSVPVRFLLPAGFRTVGIGMIVPGILIVVLRFGYHVAPEWLNWPVFAVSSQFLEHNTFSFINNNVVDEWAMLLLIVGSVFAILSREPNETLATQARRFQALIIAVWIQAGAYILVVLFSYGLSFLKALIIVLPVFPVAYIVVFATLKVQFGTPEH